MMLKRSIVMLQAIHWSFAVLLWQKEASDISSKSELFRDATFPEISGFPDFSKKREAFRKSPTKWAKILSFPRFRKCVNNRINVRLFRSFRLSLRLRVSVLYVHYKSSTHTHTCMCIAQYIFHSHIVGFTFPARCARLCLIMKEGLAMRYAISLYDSLLVDFTCCINYGGSDELDLILCLWFEIWSAPLGISGYWCFHILPSVLFFQANFFA